MGHTCRSQAGTYHTTGLANAGRPAHAPWQSRCSHSRFSGAGHLVAPIPLIKTGSANNKRGGYVDFPLDSLQRALCDGAHRSRPGDLAQGPLRAVLRRDLLPVALDLRRPDGSDPAGCRGRVNRTRAPGIAPAAAIRDSCSTPLRGSDYALTRSPDAADLSMAAMTSW